MNEDLLAKPAADPNLWLLDPTVTFLNHGSFGSCPIPVLDEQRRIRERMEKEPIQFFVRYLEPLLDEARASLAAFLGANLDNLVFVPNATTGINAVLRSLKFGHGDELLVTDHEYNACRNVLNYVAECSGASVQVVHLPFRPENDSEIWQCLESKINEKTKLLLIDHVGSQTALVFPVQKIAEECRKRNVLLLVDGAHAPGMIPLNLEQIGADFYTGNCHKWICAPKGAAFLYVRPEWQEQIRPTTISHGANSPRSDRSRFLIEFAWTGTGDPSAVLCVPKALKVMEGLMPNGWPQIMERNKKLATEAGKLLQKVLPENEILPEPKMQGSMLSLKLPNSNGTGPSSPLYGDPLQDALLADFQIEVPVIPWPAPPSRVLRISAQLYNSLPQYQKLGEALEKELKL